MGGRAGADPRPAHPPAGARPPPAARPARDVRGHRRPLPGGAALRPGPRRQLRRHRPLRGRPPGVEHPGPGARRPPRRSGRPQAGADREPAGVRGPLLRPLRQPGATLAAGPAPGGTGRGQRRLPPGAPDGARRPHPGRAPGQPLRTAPGLRDGGAPGRPGDRRRHRPLAVLGDLRRLGGLGPGGARHPGPDAGDPRDARARSWATRAPRRASPIPARRPARGWTRARGRPRPALPHPGGGCAGRCCCRRPPWPRSAPSSTCTTSSGPST